ncbi:hypothetical protein [Phaeovulum sp.]|uniref:hypothetical protein n=1 Tax=Phaeovulum sp. TaxID=2934796 RepID=UPI003561AC1A
MTALSEYQRLESTGIWRESPEAQRREVIVAFGDATLVISDGRSARALAHWSLPALVRLNPGSTPALYAPGPDADEELEIDDETMISAVEKVRFALASRLPRPGRLRLWVMLGMTAVAAALGLFWLPDALVSHVARVAPPAQRDDIGAIVLAELTTLTGAPCMNDAAEPVIEALAARLVPGKSIVLLPTALNGALALPGKVLVLGMATVQGYDGPEVAAGNLLAVTLAAETTDPLTEALDWAGLRSAFALLTTGELPQDAMKGYGQALLATVKPADKPAVTARLIGEGVDPEPWLQSLADNEPYALAAPSAVEPLMSDSDWVRLQGACMR